MCRVQKHTAKCQPVSVNFCSRKCTEDSRYICTRLRCLWSQWSNQTTPEGGIKFSFSESVLSNELPVYNLTMAHGPWFAVPVTCVCVCACTCTLCEWVCAHMCLLGHMCPYMHPQAKGGCQLLLCHPYSLRQCPLSNLELGWQLGSPSNPPGVAIMWEDVRLLTLVLGIWTQALGLAQLALLLLSCLHDSLPFSFTLWIPTCPSGI